MTNISNNELILRHNKIDGKIYWTLFDDNSEIIYPFTDYLIDLVDIEQSSPDSASNIATTLKGWHQYVASRKINIFQADDDLIEEYKKHLLKFRRHAPRNGENGVKRTINAYLRRIYKYYHWLQLENPELLLIGEYGFQITSSLEKDSKYSKDSLRYPLIFKRVGENSKHRVSFTPTQQNYDQLIVHFLSQSPEVAERNCLILSIARYVGWRVGSIASLTIDQFESSLIDQLGTDFRVQPMSQKFGYSKSFSVPFDVAIRVSAYIANGRDLIAKKHPDSPTYGKIFLSGRDGGPLTSQSISQIFSNATKSLGLIGFGKGIHSFRRTFSQELVDKEIAVNIELGLNSTVDTISGVVADKLGHENIKSQEAYVRKSMIKKRGSAVIELSDELQAERDKSEGLMHKIAELERKLLSQKAP